MDISATSTTARAQVQAKQVERRQQDEEVQQRRAQEARTREQEAASKPKPPVVNAQGQTTGRLLNVTA